MNTEKGRIFNEVKKLLGVDDITAITQIKDGDELAGLALKKEAKKCRGKISLFQQEGELTQTQEEMFERIKAKDVYEWTETDMRELIAIWKEHEG